MPHRGDSRSVQTGIPGQGDPAGDHSERGRRIRPDTLHRQEQEQGGPPDHQGEARGLRQLSHDADEVAEEALLLDVKVEQLRHLIEQDHHADPRLEAGEHRHGDEVRDEPQPQQRSRDQQAPGQGGERRRGGDQPGRVAIRHDQRKLGGDEDRNRRRRAHAQDT